jgi:hypothetical protein
MKDVGARFVQSAREFPLSVGLGKKEPSWELKRWGRDVLGFLPLAEGGYSTRGDQRRLHYAGDKTSHRFTILDNEHFEYDIILNKEPGSNRLYLSIQGWEGFDFFRQPDHIGPDMLRGSYAVYKKEGVINTPAYHVGTGKLCHIHRPRIIDARGRRVWGDIRIDRGVMTMIIPEWWISDAKYPVVVDPVVGSSVVGAYDEFDFMTRDEYEWYLKEKAKDPSKQLDRYKSTYGLGFDQDVMCNKYRAPLQLQGTYNAYVYVSIVYYYSNDSKSVVYPLLYSDLNDKPKYLLASDNTMGNPLANISNISSFTPRWVQSTLDINGSIAANTNVWFGFWGEYSVTRFDYGAPLFRACLGAQLFDYREEYNSFVEMAQDYDFYDISIFSNDITDDPDEINVYPGARYDMKVSMYLAIPESYTRTVTQWVMPAETRKLTGKYQRSATQTVQGKAIANRFEGFCRSMVQTVKSAMSLKGFPTLIRKVVEAVTAPAETARRKGYYRTQQDTAGSEDSTLRNLSIFIRLLAGGVIRDFIIGRFLKSNEEIVVKSPVCREIIIDSKLH